MNEDMGLVGPAVPESPALSMQLDQAGIASASKDAEGRELQAYRAAPCRGPVFSGQHGLRCVAHPLRLIRLPNPHLTTACATTNATTPIRRSRRRTKR